MMKIKEFLIKAKKVTYAAGGAEVDPQRPGFKELEYTEGDLNYRDSYTGYYMAPGQEVVRLNGKPVWHMTYSGGMKKEYHGDYDFVHKVFEFLKKCLTLVPEDKPYRGPEEFEEGDLRYTSELQGDFENFVGTEKIYYKGKEVFKQVYTGGAIVSK